jgi:hypothetical protein
VALAAQGVFLDFLLRAGGILKRAVVLNDQLYEARLWDLSAMVNLTLGKNISALLWYLQQTLQGKRPDPLPPPLADSGEIFFYHALYERVVEDFELRHFSSALRRASPLTRLMTAPLVGEHPHVKLEDRQLGKPAISREETRMLLLHPVLAYLLGTIANRWADLDLPDPRRNFDALIDRINCRRATLLLFMEEIEATGRFSLLIVFPLFFRRMLRNGFPQRLQESCQHRNWRVSQRERILSCHAGLFRLGRVLDQIYHRRVVEPGPYGWEHPVEIRTFAGKYGRLWTNGGLREEVAQVTQQLDRAIG